MVWTHLLGLFPLNSFTMISSSRRFCLRQFLFPARDRVNEIAQKPGETSSYDVACSHAVWAA